MRDLDLPPRDRLIRLLGRPPASREARSLHQVLTDPNWRRRRLGEGTAAAESDCSMQSDGGSGGATDDATWSNAKVHRRRLRDIRLRFPYMFLGAHVGLTAFRGWSAIVGRACEEIDRIIDRKVDFHWVLLQEESGVGRFVYALNDHSQYLVDAEGRSRRAFIRASYEALAPVEERINPIVWEAERLTAEACLICGARCGRGRYFGRDLPLCSRHQPEVINRFDEEGLEGIWRRSIEWEDAGKGF